MLCAVHWEKSNSCFNRGVDGIRCKALGSSLCVQVFCKTCCLKTDTWCHEHKAIFCEKTDSHDRRSWHVTKNIFKHSRSRFQIAALNTRFQIAALKRMNARSQIAAPTSKHMNARFQIAALKIQKHKTSPIHSNVNKTITYQHAIPDRSNMTQQRTAHCDPRSLENINIQKA